MRCCCHCLVSAKTSHVTALTDTIATYLLLPVPDCCWRYGENRVHLIPKGSRLTTQHNLLTILILRLAFSSIDEDGNGPSQHRSFRSRYGCFCIDSGLVGEERSSDCSA